MSEGKERSVGSAGSVAWPSVGMISENRLRELMADVGLPHSRSLLVALRQCDMEARLDVAASLRLTDAERGAVVAADSELSAIAHHRTPDKRECLRISTLLRALLARHGGE